jgi:hypothetical protein
VFLGAWLEEIQLVFFFFFLKNQPLPKKKLKFFFGLLRVHFSLSGQVSISCVKVFPSLFRQPSLTRRWAGKRRAKPECDKKLPG